MMMVADICGGPCEAAVPGPAWLNQASVVNVVFGIAGVDNAIIIPRFVRLQVGESA